MGALSPSSSFSHTLSHNAALQAFTDKSWARAHVRTHTHFLTHSHDEAFQVFTDNSWAHAQTYALPHTNTRII